MDIQKLMLDVIKWGESLKERSVTRDVFHKEQEEFLVKKSKLSLVRDQIAISNLILVIGQRLISQQTLAYQRDGKLYSCCKKHAVNAPNGILSVNLLFDEKLTTQQFDELEKVTIWIHSGKIC